MSSVDTLKDPQLLIAAPDYFEDSKEIGNIHYCTSVNLDGKNIHVSLVKAHDIAGIAQAVKGEIDLATKFQEKYNSSILPRDLSQTINYSKNLLDIILDPHNYKNAASEILEAITPAIIKNQQATGRNSIYLEPI